MQTLRNNEGVFRRIVENRRFLKILKPIEEPNSQLGKIIESTNKGEKYQKSFGFY